MKKEKLPDNKITFYESPDGTVNIEVLYAEENIWLTQKRMAELFDTTAQNITQHLKNIYTEREVEQEGTCAELVPGLPMLGFCDKDTVSIPKSHLKPIVANTQSVTVVRSTEFNNIPMLERVGTLTQNDKFPFNSDLHLLWKAQERLLSPWMLQDDEHENYRALFPRLLTPTNGIHESALSASRMSRSSLATSSDVESSKKSIKSSNIFLDIAEDGATMPRIFSSLIMVIGDLFMNGSVASTDNFRKVVIVLNTKPPIGMGGFVSHNPTGHVVARDVSLLRRLWCRGSLATTSFYTSALREFHAPTGQFSEANSWRQPLLT